MHAMFLRLPLMLTAALGLLQAVAAQSEPVAAAGSAVPPAPTFVQPSPAVVDFGDLFDGQPARTTVTFTNTSEADRALSQVKTSCGCTVATVHGPDGEAIPSKSANPQLPIVTLHPGQAIQVDVEMTTTNQRGSVEKQLQVYPMDSSLSMVQVPVRARVAKAFMISPESLSLGTKLPKTGPIEQTLVIESQIEGDWSIEGFTSGMEGKPLPADLQFNVLDKEGPKRRVQVISGGPRTIGALTLKVHVNINHEKIKGTDFYVYGVVVPDVSFDTGDPNFPSSISFGQMETGSKVTKTLKITNADKSTPYVLRSVNVDAPKPEFFTTAIRTIEEGVSYEVDVTADAAINEAFFRGMLVLNADHPELKDQKILFHGWVKKG
jgi:hypothetical protein